MVGRQGARSEAKRLFIGWEDALRFHRMVGGTEQSLRERVGVCGGEQEALLEIRRGRCRQEGKR